MFFFLLSSDLCCVGSVSDKELPRTSRDQHTGAKAKTKWHEHDCHQVRVPFSILLTLTFFCHLVRIMDWKVIV